MITLTPEHIAQLRTPAGGYNQRTMELLGEWPLTAGWKERMVGQQVGDRRWRQALAQVTVKRQYFRGNTRRK